MQVIPSGQILGANVKGTDLAERLSDADVRTILRALGQYGVLCFPAQALSVAQFAAFGRRFGELEVNVANTFHEAGFPEVMILSNMTDETGEPIGLGDAGQGWHTDMSYARQIALANILHCQRVPWRYDKPLGETQFRSMHAAYDDLPASIKHSLEGLV
jgi:taurine dioxygenase